MMRDGKKDLLLLWGGLLLLIAGIAVLNVYENVYKPWRLRGFQTAAEVYRETCSNIDVKAGSTSFTGRVVPIDPHRGSVDELYWDLPRTLRAQSPADVTMVLCLNWKPFLIGNYSDGTTAYGYDCEGAIVDVSSKRLVARRSFVRSTVISSGPPRKVWGGDLHYKGTEEIVAWIYSLIVVSRGSVIPSEYAGKRGPPHKALHPTAAES
jgi:hypothetical protein